MKKLIIAVVMLAHGAFGQVAEPGLALAKSWEFWLSNSKDSMVAKDLKEVMGHRGEPKIDLAPHPELVIYRGVNYLMPLQDAIKVLKLPGVWSKSALVCPGWPPSCFSYYSFSGLFEGHYNKLLLVVDKAEQVVAVELVDESPGNVERRPPHKRWHAYDYVQTQTKADITCLIAQEIKHPSRDMALSIVTQFYGKTGQDLVARTLQEDVRLFLPQPMVDLLLYCLK